VETSLTWLGRLVAGADDADWRRLLDAFGPLLNHWLARAGVPPADRDDLVQEVLVVVVRRVGEFERRGPGAFRAWLRGILANHTKKFFRTRPKPAAIDLDLLAGDGTELSRAWDREHDEHLAARALRAVEGDFAPATWQAFRRQVFDGLSPTAVAEETGLSLNAVILAKSRVLKRLRAELRGLAE
jgi:RNA polymerase sigma-70 factor (ECF subfamily)